MQCAKCLSLLRITQSGKTCLYSRERALPSTAGAGQAFVPTGAGFDPPKNRPLQCCANRIVLLKLRPALFPLLLVTPTFERSVILKAKCVLQLLVYLPTLETGISGCGVFDSKQKKILLFCHVTVNIIEYL